jgi:penicillin G amidase
LRTVNDQSYALSWLAHDSEAINANLAKIMFAKNVDEGMVVAQTSGMPHQNFHIVDKSGNVAWTIAGKIPTRGDDAKTRKWLNAADYPVVRNPPNGRTWTGNNRQLGGAGGALIGEGGPDLGARAQQIRDRLLEKDVMSETDLHAIQLDNEARFLNRWAALATVTASSQKNSAVLPILRSWTLRADADQVGYRVARSFRLKVMDALWASWLSAAAPKLTDKKTWDGRFEYASWRALEERPIHLLPQPHKSWDEFLQHSLDATVNELITNSGSLEKATWGARNTTRIAHPFSRVIPALSSYLDMPAMPISGDNHMPKVAGPSFGQSQRLVVSPGREQDGILSMPGGQSGHPLSPFYGAGHSAWLRGEKTPLLAGTPLHTLVVSAPQ